MTATTLERVIEARSLERLRHFYAKHVIWKEHPMAKNAGDLALGMTGVGETILLKSNGRDIETIAQRRNAAGDLELHLDTAEQPEQPAAAEPEQEQPVAPETPATPDPDVLDDLALGMTGVGETDLGDDGSESDPL